MSLRIEMNKVVAVLLSEGWYVVDPQTDPGYYTNFYVDAYEYGMEIDDGDFDIAYAANDKKVIPKSGFAFKTNGAWVMGPLSAIQAVRMKKEETE
jgi:hypothetical protein